MELSLIKPLLKNNVALLLQYAVGAAVPFLLVPQLARSLGLEEFGALSVMLAWASYATAFIHYAFHLTGPARAARASSGEIPRLVSAVLQARGLLLAASVPVLLLAFAIGLIPRTTAVAVALMLVVMPLAAAAETTWQLQASERFTHIAALSILGTAIATLIGFGLVDGPDASSISWAAAALAAGAITTAIGSFALTAFAVGRLPLASGGEVRAVLTEGRPLFASQLVALVYGGSGPIIIGWLSGLPEAGTYSVMARLVIALCVVSDMLHTAAFPTLARLYPVDRAGYLRLVRLVILSYLSVAVTIGVVGWTFREPVLAYLYGAQGAGLHGLYLLGLLWIASAVFGGVVTGYFAVSGQPAKAYRLNLVVMVVTIGTGIPAVLVFGAMGWIAAIVAGQSVIALSALHHWKKERELLA